MKNIKSKEEVIQHKKASIRKLNALLEKYIQSDQKELLKKTDLISYWIETYASYIDSETVFDSSKLLRYTRGNVIRVNLGFNIGKEMGGLHYAVVIDNDSKRNADVLTVVPLSSTDGKTVHNRSVDLGTELYEKIKTVQQNLLDKAQSELKELTETYDVFCSTVNILNNIKYSGNIPDGLENKLQEALAYQAEMEIKREALEKHIKTIKRNGDEISKLKIGSMAVTNQITTISKQRIYTPKKSEDFLYGISLSASAMEKINDKIIELYVHK